MPPGLRPPPDGGRPSAVLILFGDGPGGPDLLLVQRSRAIRRHAGQPAFPGGAIDPADGGAVAAALREAAEETGVDPAGVQVLGVLPELFISRSGFSVTPVLAWWRAPVPVAPGDPAEVTGVSRVPVAELADPANRLSIRLPSGQAGPAFRAGSHAGVGVHRAWWWTGCWPSADGSCRGTRGGWRTFLRMPTGPRRGCRSPARSRSAAAAPAMLARFGPAPGLARCPRWPGRRAWRGRYGGTRARRFPGPDPDRARCGVRRGRVPPGFHHRAC